MQVGDILDRQEVEWDLHITYLMSMDRVMSFNRPFSLKVVCNSLRNIYVLEAHSSRTFHLLGDRCWDTQPKVISCSQTMGRMAHYGYLVFKKERNLETGRIESFEIDYSTFVFIDDLCDAGGTFLGDSKRDSKFIIIVCVNDKGLVNMCNNFDQVLVPATRT